MCRISIAAEATPRRLKEKEQPEVRDGAEINCGESTAGTQRFSLLLYWPAMSLSRLFAVSAIAAMPVLAQPFPQNGRGITLSHIGVNSADPDAAIAFWKDVIGTSTYSRGSLNGVSTLGALIVFTKRAAAGPSAGTAIDHLAFRVPDLQPFIERLAKTPFKSFQSPSGGDVLTIDGPDGVRIELTADSSMYAPLEFSHIEFHTPKPSDTQAWYGKYFGARPAEDDSLPTSRLPGATLKFGAADSAAPTAGRAIDHLTFEVKDLATFSKNLTEAGLKVEPTAQGGFFLTDPWGTRIELTEAPAH
jgi:catechol 2,3-dioxygenase-like lactoylglutathione lyase family enzyme